jgi:glycosyltransferase involved in cell wall biosynthesis
MILEMDKPLVSVSCITYNHEAFIADAIEGFLAQQTPFPVEILIHDDASTDRTAEIVRTYERAHPHRISAIYQHENQYSRGALPSHFNYSRARGKYIALCEGDDCWTDPLKLAKQVEALESHPHISLCFHPARRIRYGNDIDHKLIGRYANGNAIIPVEDVINKSQGMIPTASCVITKSAADELVKFRAEQCGARVGDVVVQILSSYTGGAIYLDEEMSIYRFKTPGSFNSRLAGNASSRLCYARDRINVMLALDAYFQGKFSKAFARQNQRWMDRIATARDYTRRQKMDFYSEFSPQLNILSRLEYLIKTLLIPPKQ